eukprot:GFUD01026561.1.p1 GENE.GFUD01026561.1~~GFUD01026561.1.p1  ORF type:complete len:899 (-),score=198.15 GFUD01026561.1:15-2711(-)
MFQLAMLTLFAILCLPSVVAPDTGVTNYLPVDIAAPHGSQSANMQVLIPTVGEHPIANPDQLFEHVKTSWDTVVESNQAGLADPKQGNFLPSGLSKQEAWHHFQAGQEGVVDSARFLITFSMVPSVQSGGSPLHIAASLGNLERVQALIDDGARVDAAKEDGTTPMHSAATMGHSAVVKLLIEEGAWVENTGNNGATALMMAAAMGNLDVISTLLDGGANPNTRHAFGKTTALHFAAEVGRAEAVELLCRRGADVEAEKTTGGGPLHTAADANQTEVVRVLVKECGANINKLLMKDTTPLYLAAQRGFSEVVIELIQLGADVNYVMPRGKHGGHLIALSSEEQITGHYPMKNTEIGNGATALHAAVENGHLETSKILLESGAVQSDSMEGATPLIIALQYRHPNIGLLLLEETYSDPKINAKVPVDGSSALFVASGYGYDKVVKKLLKREANPNIKNRQGATSLSHALMNRHQNIVTLLLQYGAISGDDKSSNDSPSTLHAAVQSKSLTLVKQVLNAFPKANLIKAVNAKANDDQTPLHFSVKGPLEIVQFLLDNGANSNSLVKSTLATPLHMAALHGRVDVAKLLLKYGAKLEPRGSDKLYGATPIYLASQNGNLEMVHELIVAGADVNCRLRKIGVTPLFVAAERGHHDVVKLLLEHNATPHARNWNGVTALGVSAMANRINIVQELLIAGAEVNSRDNDGNSIIMNCLISEETSSPSTSPQVMLELLKAGSDPDLKNKKGKFPIMILSEKDSKEQSTNAKWVDLLLENGASVNSYYLTNIDGVEFKETALTVATMKGATEIVKVLLIFDALYNIPIHGKYEKLILPLGISIQLKNLELTKLFLEHGAKHCYYNSIAEKSPELDGCMELAVGSRNFDSIQLISLYEDKVKTPNDEL